MYVYPCDCVNCRVCVRCVFEDVPGPCEENQGHEEGEVSRDRDRRGNLATHSILLIYTTALYKNKKVLIRLTI